MSSMRLLGASWPSWLNVGTHYQRGVFFVCLFLNDILFKMNSEGKVAHVCFRAYPFKSF